MEFKNKNNKKIQRNDYYQVIKESLEEANKVEEGDEKQVTELKLWVDYRNADVDFCVEVYRDLIVFATCPGYKTKWSKYNL